MVRGVLIPAADGRDLTAYEAVELEDYQRAVGGWIEAVDLPAFGSTLFVNEEGLLRGSPFNRRATFLWWFHVPRARNQARLVGDALLVGLPDKAGEMTDLPDDALRSLLSDELWDLELRDGPTEVWSRDPSGEQSYIEAVVWSVLVSEVSDAETRLVRRH
ncbi:DUF3846 domain-containing protein [Microbacterium sp. SORGH_AS_0862]|uniref:DUF3846 domain-containing protein n=1 Tax=Microbacterium sp. SORGH_AS_0862 TaxID=3041789 RepID=UPI00278CC514|nr:DUF3846 domain-containing protein [Microbacterium sp. SORGH_AS_0862]MDQ1206229.1 hypothetical protein [Microbacterium sp. SORGH_AS_0862]